MYAGGAKAALDNDDAYTIFGRDAPVLFFFPHWSGEVGEGGESTLGISFRFPRHDIAPLADDDAAGNSSLTLASETVDALSPMIALLTFCAFGDAIFVPDALPRL